MADEKKYTIKEAAKLLGVTKTLIYNNKDRFPSLSMEGGIQLISKFDIINYEAPAKPHRVGKNYAVTYCSFTKFEKEGDHLGWVAANSFRRASEIESELMGYWPVTEIWVLDGTKWTKVRRDFKRLKFKRPKSHFNKSKQVDLESVKKKG